MKYRIKLRNKSRPNNQRLSPATSTTMIESGSKQVPTSVGTPVTLQGVGTTQSKHLDRPSGLRRVASAEGSKLVRVAVT